MIRPPLLKACFVIVLSAGAIDAAAQLPIAFGSPTAGVRTNKPPGDFAYQILRARPALTLTPFTPDAPFRERTGRFAPKSLGPFDASRYGFDTLRLYFDREMWPEDLRGATNTNSTLKLAIELDRRPAAAVAASRTFPERRPRDAVHRG